MSFFVKVNPRTPVKRKFDKKHKKNEEVPTTNKSRKKDNSGSEIDSEEEYSAHETSSENEHETAQEKKLRLAKKYLEEIDREEKIRADQKNFNNESAISKRLKEDYLEQSGRLRKSVADSYTGYDSEGCTLMRAKENGGSVTCLCVSVNNEFIFSGSKNSGIVKWCLKTKRKVAAIPFKKKNKAEKFTGHSTDILCLAISTDSKFLAAGDKTNDIQIWNPCDMSHVRTFRGHRGAVTGLVFRKDTHQLYSVSADRSLKVWSLDEMSHVETMFGHQAAITAIDALARERCVTAGGRDGTLRVWKIAEESQLIFNGHSGSIDTIKLVNEEHFVSGGEDGLLCIWGTMKKKPLFSVTEAHGKSTTGEVNWITSIAALINTDLIATGSQDGFIRLWKLSDSFRNITKLLEIPVTGFINALSFAASGAYLIAGIAQEHRAGRWWRLKEAKNGILIIPLVRSITNQKSSEVVK